MKRQVVCHSCCVITKSIALFVAEIGEGEYSKVVKGKAQRDYLCDHCNILIYKGDECYCNSIWIPSQGMLYFEWEFNFVDNPEVCYGTRDDKLFDAEHFTLHEAGLDLRSWLERNQSL
jgi:hypothetical protein